MVGRSQAALEYIIVSILITILIYLMLTFIVENSDPKIWINDTTKCSTSQLTGQTIIDINRILLCPDIFRRYISSLAPYRTEDQQGEYLDLMESISIVILHEFLHYLFDDISKFD